MFLIAETPRAFALAQLRDRDRGCPSTALGVT
jgi:hypothetical protein